MGLDHVAGPQPVGVPPGAATHELITTVFALAPLSDRFDAADGPLDVDRYADSVADLLIAGVRLT